MVQGNQFLHNFESEVMQMQDVLLAIDKAAESLKEISSRLRGYPESEQKKGITLVNGMVDGLIALKKELSS